MHAIVHTHSVIIDNTIEDDNHMYSSFILVEQVAKEGIPLPPDQTVCPLCSQKRTNPSTLAVSGFVFCYACIFKYVSQVSFL